MKILKFTYKTLSIVVLIVLSIVLVSNVFLIVNKHLLNNPYPNVFGYSTAIVISGSMEPHINVNDMVVIKAQDEYKKGDVISFVSGKSLITHRIADITDAGFITKGDANNVEDKEPVSCEQVMGKVICAIPYVGLIIGFLQTPLGIMILILMAILPVIIPTLFEKE